MSDKTWQASALVAPKDRNETPFAPWFPEPKSTKSSAGFKDWDLKREAQEEKKRQLAKAKAQAIAQAQAQAQAQAASAKASAAQAGQAPGAAAPAQKLQLTEAEFKKVQADAFKLGVTKGREATQGQVAQERAAEKALINEMLAQWRGFRANTTSWVEPLKKLSLAVGQELARAHFKFHPEAVNDLVLSCAESIGEAREKVSIHLNESDLKRLRTLEMEWPSGWQLVADSRMSVGSVRIRADNAEVEDFMEHRLAVLAQQLLDPNLPALDPEQFETYDADPVESPLESTPAGATESEQTSAEQTSLPAGDASDRDLADEGAPAIEEAQPSELAAEGAAGESDAIDAIDAAAQVPEALTQNMEQAQPTPSIADETGLAVPAEGEGVVDDPADVTTAEVRDSGSERSNALATPDPAASAEPLSEGLGERAGNRDDSASQTSNESVQDTANGGSAQPADSGPSRGEGNELVPQKEDATASGALERSAEAEQIPDSDSSTSEPPVNAPVDGDAKSEAAPVEAGSETPADSAQRENANDGGEVGTPGQETALEDIHVESPLPEPDDSRVSEEVETPEPVTDSSAFDPGASANEQTAPPSDLGEVPAGQEDQMAAENKHAVDAGQPDPVVTDSVLEKEVLSEKLTDSVPELAETISEPAEVKSNAEAPASDAATNLEAESLADPGMQVKADETLALDVSDFKPDATLHSKPETDSAMFIEDAKLVAPDRPLDPPSEGVQGPS